jgi:hypothetical protein
MVRKYTKPKRPIRRHHGGCGAVRDNARKKTLYVQAGGYVPPAGTGPKGGKAGPILGQWARGIPQGIASTAINRTPLGEVINVVGTGVRAARGKLGTKGPVNVGGTITSGIGSRMKERRARRKAKRKARKAKG